MDTRQIIGTESDFIESEGFANCETEAAKNFILYKQYGQQLKPDDRVKEIGLTMFSKEIRFDYICASERNNGESLLAGVARITCNSTICPA